MKDFVNKSYSLNYELLKKTCTRYESKLLDTESEMEKLKKTNEILVKKIDNLNKRAELANRRIKEMAMVEGGRGENHVFSTNTSDIVPRGNQSPWLDLSDIQKMQGQTDRSPEKNNKDGSTRAMLKNTSMGPEITPTKEDHDKMYYSNVHNEKLRSPKFTKTLDIDNMCNFFSNQNLDQSRDTPSKSLKALPIKNLHDKSITDLNGFKDNKKHPISQRNMNSTKGLTYQSGTKKNISIKRS